MTINLSDLAKQANKTYIDVSLSIGAIRVYHVPDAAMLSATIGRPEPEQPIVIMKTATGTQDRLAKKGDKIYEEWLVEKSDYDEELFKLRSAIGVVMALKDIDWDSVDLAKPPTDLAKQVYNGNWPDNEVLRKKIWLDFTILSKRSDQNKILEALNEMNGQNEPSAEMVDEVKKNSE